jgi:hypothetical protein
MIVVMTTDGPESMNVMLVNESLSCSADGNPTPDFQWIELAAPNNTSHLGHELNLCNTVTFKTVQQATGISTSMWNGLSFSNVLLTEVHT